MHAGLALGAAGLTLANAAQTLHAQWLEPVEQRRRRLLHEVARRARLQQQAAPDLPGAWYWFAHALGLTGRGLRLTQALACGLGPQVLEALSRTLALAPHHASAWLALGVFHAELVDQLGDKLAAALGARRAAGLEAFERALALDPGSPGVRLEYAHGLLRLEGESALAKAEALLAEAAACPALDAIGQLQIERARQELAD